MAVFAAMRQPRQQRFGVAFAGEPGQLLFDLHRSPSAQTRLSPSAAEQSPHECPDPAKSGTSGQPDRRQEEMPEVAGLGRGRAKRGQPSFGESLVEVADNFLLTILRDEKQASLWPTPGGRTGFVGAGAFWA
jgi:hypothetical protein